MQVSVQNQKVPSYKDAMKMLMVDEKEYASVLSYKLMFDSGNYIIKPRGG